MTRIPLMHILGFDALGDFVEVALSLPIIRIFSRRARRRLAHRRRWI